MQPLIRWAVTAAALYATVLILAALGMATVVAGTPWYSWFIAVIIMGLVNALIRPVARLLTAPLNCLTFGLMGIVVNAVMFWLVPFIAESAGMPLFRVTPLGALAGSLLVGVINAVASSLIIQENEK